MKKRTLKRAIIACTLILTLCLTGCGLFPTNTSKLKQLLEDKYGEKFGVESHYFAGDMWATCYPESDPTLLFEVRTNAEVTKISHDYYLQTVVERQVNTEYEPLVQQVFPGSFVSSDLSASDYEGQTADKVTLESMLQYNNSTKDDDEVGWTYIVLNIFVDTSQMLEENIEKEYEFLTEEIRDRVANGDLPETIVKLYFGEREFVQECEEILAEQTWSGSSDIYDKIEDIPGIRIYYYSGENCRVNLAGDDESLTYEKYLEERMEVLRNE